MKKSATSEDRSRQSRTGSVRKSGIVPAITTAKEIKLSPPRRQEPAGLLEEHIAGDGEVRAVSFEYFNPDAREVLLTGSFNGWQPSSTPMSKQHGGRWFRELLLSPGTYEYRLVVDGQWQDDPMAERFVANSFGGLNCVLEVKTGTTRAAGRP